MAKTKLVSKFANGQTIVNYVPAEVAGALAFADAHLNTPTDAYEVMEVTPEPASITQAYLVQVTGKSSDYRSVGFKFYMKVEKGESDIKTALVNTTWDGVLINEVTIVGMTLITFS